MDTHPIGRRCHLLHRTITTFHAYKAKQEQLKSITKLQERLTPSKKAYAKHKTNPSPDPPRPPPSQSLIQYAAPPVRGDAQVGIEAGGEVEAF